MRLEQTSSLTITNALIFDGHSEDLSEGSIHVVDGVISQIADSVTGSAAGDVIDGRGKVVIPGLIDAHFHAYGFSLNGLVMEKSPLSYSALVGAKRLRAALMRGFTTVRDVAGGDPGLANAVARGLIESPRYFFTGPALSQTGGHGDPRPADLDLCFSGGHMCEVVDGADDLLKAVRSRLRQGAHAIKIMASGGVVSPVDPIRIPQYTAAEIRTVTEEANRRGSYVAAHAYSPEAIHHAITNGVRSIEHGNLLDAETARLMAANNSYLIPTLVTYDAMNRRGNEVGISPSAAAKNQEVLDAGKAAVQIAHREGVAVGFGSDLMGDLENDQLIGLQLQTEASGILNTLRSATSVNASLLRSKELGSIAEGCAGDFVILDGNPFRDPSVLWDEAKPRTVIQAGKVVSGHDA